MKIYDTSGNELTERPDYNLGRLVQDAEDADKYIYTTWEELPAGDGNGETPKTKDEKLADLDAQYDSDKAEIMQYYTEAVFANDIDLQNELKVEMREIDNQYIEDRKAIEDLPDDEGSVE